MEMFNHPKASGYQPANDPVAKLQEEFHKISDEVSRLGTGFRTLHKTIDSLAKVGNRMIFNWMVMTASARGFGSMSSVFPMDVRHWMASSSWGHGHGRNPFAGRRGMNPRGRNSAYFGTFVPPGGPNSPPPDFGGSGPSGPTGPGPKPKNPGPYVGPGGSSTFGQGPNLSPNQTPEEEPVRASAYRGMYDKIHGRAQELFRRLEEAHSAAQHPDHKSAWTKDYKNLFSEEKGSVKSTIINPLKKLAKAMHGRDGFEGVADEAERMASTLETLLANVKDSLNLDMGPEVLNKIKAGKTDTVSLRSNADVYAKQIENVKTSIQALFGDNPKIRSEFDQVDFRAQAAKTAGVTPAVVHAFDTETTGTGPGSKALSIGWGSSDGRKGQVFIDPGDDYAWDSQAHKDSAKVHKIFTRKDLEDRAKQTAFGRVATPAEAFAEFLKQNKVQVLAGFNVDFDKGMLAELGQRAGRSAQDVQAALSPYSFKEVANEIREAFGLPNTATLDDVRKKLNLSTSDSHDAATDSVDTATAAHQARVKVSVEEAEKKAGGLGSGSTPLDRYDQHAQNPGGDWGGPRNSLIRGSGPTIGRKAAESLIEEIHREFKLKARPEFHPGVPQGDGYASHEYLKDQTGLDPDRHSYRFRTRTAYTATHEAAHAVYAESDSQIQARMRKYGRIWRLASPIRSIMGRFGSGSRDQRDEEGYADMFASRRTGGSWNPIKMAIASWATDKVLGGSGTSMWAGMAPRIPRRGDWELRQIAENLAVRTGTYTGTSPVYANKNRYRNVWRMVREDKGVPEGFQFIDHKASKRAGKIVGTNDPSRARLKRYTDEQNPVGVLEGRELVHKKGDLIHGGANWHDRLGQATAMPFLAGTAIAGGGIRAASPDVFDTVAGHAKLAMTKASGGFIGPGLSLASTFKDIGDWADRRSDTTKSTVGNVAVFGTIALGLGLAFSKIGKAAFGASVALDVFRAKFMSAPGAIAGGAGWSRGFNSPNAVGMLGTAGAVAGGIGGYGLGTALARNLGLKNQATVESFGIGGSLLGMGGIHALGTHVGNYGLKSTLSSRSAMIAAPVAAGYAALSITNPSGELEKDPGFMAQGWGTKRFLGVMETYPDWARRAITPAYWSGSSADADAALSVNLKEKGFAAETIKKSFITDPSKWSIVDAVYADNDRPTDREGRIAMADRAVAAYKKATGQDIEEQLNAKQFYPGVEFTSKNKIRNVFGTFEGSQERTFVHPGLDYEGMRKARGQFADLVDITHTNERTDYVKLFEGRVSKLDELRKAELAHMARTTFPELAGKKSFTDKEFAGLLNDSKFRNAILPGFDKILESEKKLKDQPKQAQIEGKTKEVLSMAWATSVTPEMMGLEDVYRQVQMSVLKSPLEQQQESENLKNLEKAIRDLGELLGSKLDNIDGSTDRLANKSSAFDPTATL